MPDADLRLRVASTPQSEDDYRRVGGWNADIIKAEIQRHGSSLDQIGTLLDFGCGCGRALQYLHKLSPHTVLYGCDIDEAAIAWCQQHLPYARCQVNHPEPPLNYPDQTFDAVVALSVFSHLDAPMQRRWLAELGRVLRPGGYLFISFSGPFVWDRYLDNYPPENVREFERTGFTFVRNITDGLFPAWYQTSLQTEAFVSRCLPPGLRVAGYLEQGLSGWQDTAMIRRHADPDRFSPTDGASQPEPAAADSGQGHSGVQEAFATALGSPGGQAALRAAVLDSWQIIQADTKGMVGLRSTLRSARFVERHIPLYLARGHGQLRHAALNAAPKGGLFLEFGVFRGHWLNQFAALLPETVFYGFDSFEGLPEQWSLYETGHFSLRGESPAVAANVRLVKGWFSETLPGFLDQHAENVSFIHMDCDLYSSTKTVLDLLKGRIRVGTQIVLDDFMQAPGWENAEFRAFFEFIEANCFGFEYTGWSAESPGCSVSIAITSVE